MEGASRPPPLLRVGLVEERPGGRALAEVAPDRRECCARSRRRASARRASPRSPDSGGSRSVPVVVAGRNEPGQREAGVARAAGGLVERDVALDRRRPRAAAERFRVRLAARRRTRPARTAGGERGRGLARIARPDEGRRRGRARRRQVCRLERDTRARRRCGLDRSSAARAAAFARRRASSANSASRSTPTTGSRSPSASAERRPGLARGDVEDAALGGQRAGRRPAPDRLGARRVLELAGALGDLAAPRHGARRSTARAASGADRARRVQPVRDDAAVARRADASTRGELVLYVARGFLGQVPRTRAAPVHGGREADRLRGALDGEPVALVTPLEFTIEPRALRVLVPPARRRPRGVEGELLAGGSVAGSNQRSSDDVVGRLALALVSARRPVEVQRRGAASSSL